MESLQTLNTSTSSDVLMLQILVDLDHKVVPILVPCKPINQIMNKMCSLNKQNKIIEKYINFTSVNGSVNKL